MVERSRRERALFMAPSLADGDGAGQTVGRGWACNTPPVRARLRDRTRVRGLSKRFMVDPVGSGKAEQFRRAAGP